MITILSTIALVFGGFIAFFNGYAVWVSRKSGKRVSSVPLIGGLLLTAGFWGFHATRPYAWFGLFIDCGTLDVIRAAPRLIRDAWQTSLINLLYRFTCEQNGRQADIRLFKNGIFTIECFHKPPVACNESCALVQRYGFVGKWLESDGVFRLEGYAEKRVLEIRKEGEGFAAREHNYPLERKYPYDNLDELRLTMIT